MASRPPALPPLALRRSWRSSAIAVAALLAARAALAGPAGSPSPAPVDSSPASHEEDLNIQWENAVNYFKYRDFDRAIEKLAALLYPTCALELKRELKAREYLAAAYWWQGKKEAAVDEFNGLLVRSPRTKLDPALYPPKMIDDFETRRRRLVDTGVIKSDALGPDIDGPPPTKLLPPPMGLMAAPFGVGQFANREPTKGWLFFAGEALIGGTSAALYLRNRDAGRVGSRPWKDDALQITAGAAFWLLVGWGVWDAFSTYKAQWPDAPSR